MPSKTKTLLPLVLLCGTAFGQAGMPPSETFHVLGTVRDPSGAVIPKAKVEFHAVTNKTITFNFTLRIQGSCDITIVRNDGGTPTAEDWEAAKRDFCLREESLSIPSIEGFPFQVVIRFSKRSAADDKYSYTGAKEPYDDPVFVAYNLFSLEADRVVYDAKTNTIRAAGNVAAMDESGKTPRASLMAFKLEDGKAIPIE